MNDFTLKLKLLPESSGVYVMLDIKRKIIYIGKAKNLRNRVKQYFQAGNKNQKTLSLVEKIYDFEYIVTSSEIEALVLENNLIKLHKPYYNILLKDDKTYPYIKINIKEEFPSLEVVRKIKKDGKYFGPYMLGVSANSLLELIHEVYPIRSCVGNFSGKRNRVCLEYHLGKCLGPCVNKVEKKEYDEVIKEVIYFLSGEDTFVRNILTQKINLAIQNEQFELAIRYRDYILLLDKLNRKQSVNIPKDLNADIFTYASNGLFGTINNMLVRGGRLIGSSNTGVSEIGEKEDIVSSFIMQYYDNNPIIADEIFVEEKLTFIDELSSLLSAKKGTKTIVSIPVKGVKKDLVDLSKENAKEYLEKSITLIKNKEAMTIGAVEKLASLLNIQGFLQRIECFDISNISGTNKVASMVVFINGEPQRKLYRMFKIRSVEGSNDFASMREAVSRRLNELKKGEDNSFLNKPDLIIVDGGKGQISAVSDLIISQNIGLIGLAERNEEIYKANESEPIILSKDNVILKLCQRIRDEAHRFAINYHKKLRDNSMIRSELKNINGIGDKKAILLLDYFKTVAKISAAPIEELQKAKGISLKDSDNIYKYYHSKE